MADRSGEMNFDEPRNLSGPERTRRFQARQAHVQALAANISTEETRWYLVDEPLTPEQYDPTPLAISGVTRTPPLWVKFRHKWRHHVVVARGYFDHDGAVWAARLSPVDDGDDIGDVEAMAWAPIVKGVRPWEGPTIPMYEAEPW